MPRGGGFLQSRSYSLDIPQPRRGGLYQAWATPRVRRLAQTVDP
jgi:hypothetical protein